MAFFLHTREKTVTKKVDGIPVLLKDETGADIPGKFETEIEKMTDVINTDLIIRCHMIKPDHVIVLLNDGHEMTERVNALKNKLKPPTPGNVVEEKVRQYVQSEISIKGQDEVTEFYALLSKIGR